LHGLDWVAGLAQGWAHPSSASEPQKTANHLPSSQHRSILHSSSPCNIFFMHSAPPMPGYTKHCCASIRIELFVHTELRCEFANVLQSARGEIRRIGSLDLDHSSVACHNSILDRLVYNLLHCRDDRVSPLSLPWLAELNEQSKTETLAHV